MVDRLRRPPSLYEMVKHPWATMTKIAGLNRLPDRRVTKRVHHGGSYAGGRDPSDPIRREARTQSIYKALGIYAIEETRTELYENYREMDTDPLIAAVLDAFADDAAQKDSERKRVVWVESENADIARIVTETLDRLRVDEWAFPVMRSLARDGDVFMHVAASRGHGAIALRPYEPWVVARIEDDIGRLVGFAPADEQGEPTHEGESSVPFYRALHFRLPPREMTDIYGATSSFLWGSRVVWRQLQLMEDQVVLQRLLRRPDRIMILMDTTGMSHDEAWFTVKDYERRLHREWYQNTDQNFFQSFGVPLDLAKDVVLPRGSNNQTEFTNFPATDTNDLLRDLDMFLMRLAAGVGFPLGFIGRGDPGTYIPGQSLSRQSEQFAKRSSRLQQAFLPEIARLCMIDLSYKGIDPYRPQNAFKLNMTTVSPIQEIERSEVIQLKTDRLERALAIGEQYQFNLGVWVPLVLERYGGFSKQLINRVYPTGDEAQASPAELSEIAGAIKELDDDTREAAVSMSRVLPTVNESASCSSRYVLDLSQVNEEERAKLKPQDAVLPENFGQLHEDAARERSSASLDSGESLISEKVQAMLAASGKKKRVRSMETRIRLVTALAGGLDL